MNSWGGIIIILNIVLIGIILFNFIHYWSLGISLLVLCLIIMISRIDMKKRLTRGQKNRKEWATIVSNRIKDIIHSMDQIRLDLRRNMFMVENGFEDKIDQQYSKYEKKMDTNYRELARKILEIENKVNEMKKTIT